MYGVDTYGFIILWLIFNYVFVEFVISFSKITKYNCKLIELGLHFFKFLRISYSLCQSHISGDFKVFPAGRSVLPLPPTASRVESTHFELAKTTHYIICQVIQGNELISTQNEF